MNLYFGHTNIQFIGFSDEALHPEKWCERIHQGDD